MPCQRGLIALICLTIIVVITTICQSFHTNFLTVGRNGTLRYEPTELDLGQMRFLAGLSDSENLRQTVQRIAIKRVPSTSGHSKVRNYIVDYLKKLNWNVELDIFTQKVPIMSAVTFHNIVARQNPRAKRYLMFGCHYDSKYFKDFDFMAATDSAVSCALMLNMATILRNQFHNRSDISLMLVFFDGEEAFGEWSAEDSLYGSRHLAELWEQHGFLDRIDLFLLLDLIGASDVVLRMNIPSTSGWFRRLVQLEKKLFQAGILPLQRPLFKFEPGTDIDDDHLPFMLRNVPVIHLISNKYPAVWHLAEDLERNVDYNTTEQVALVLRMFVMEYLNSAPSTSNTVYQ
ncbi:glutaminyl-peptide cyclotransferase [Drosophila yakuba]|uniref:glutaminyl-peptide cyclotransferase n=1 Tax=Drosophila yakuba TaxID=7245 RepID=B4PF32_DROYA|nr:glutaminyl-peptide cyclotransferase [Drosophila yakuba]EDW94114.1 uncharacterized protein Dyak_GE20221 [Drosophila yakuba]